MGAAVLLALKRDRSGFVIPARESRGLGWTFVP
jgi:hypothetical protein